jgi:hypothetical protein
LCVGDGVDDGGQVGQIPILEIGGQGRYVRGRGMLLERGQLVIQLPDLGGPFLELLIA